jgi:hypothetical protein
MDREIVMDREAEARARQKTFEDLGYRHTESMFLACVKWGLAALAVLFLAGGLQFLSGEPLQSVEDWPYHYQFVIYAAIGAGYLYHRHRDKAWWARYEEHLASERGATDLQGHA